MSRLFGAALVGTLAAIFILAGYMMFQTYHNSYRLVGYCDGKIMYANEEDEFRATNCQWIERNN